MFSLPMLATGLLLRLVRSDCLMPIANVGEVLMYAKCAVQPVRHPVPKLSYHKPSLTLHSAIMFTLGLGVTDVCPVTECTAFPVGLRSCLPFVAFAL